ncbi:MAG: TonB-dependent receptor [Flavobacteriaceae bacterium]|nr:MAG: TonB-dependent receptor [Flavobacteriaceae bacterium]
MKRIYTIILFFCFYFSVGQNKDEGISLSYENATIKEVLNTIEETTGYHFFYVDAWLGSELVSGNYDNAPINDILESVLKKTIVNFYIMDDDKIVLTRNTIIYDSLPKNYFGSPEDELAIDGGLQEAAPLFYEEESSSAQQNINTVRIGRENRNSNRQKFTISGQAINAKTGEAIQDLAIIVKETNFGTTTDTNGYYEMELSIGRNTIVTKALGFQDTELRAIVFNDGQLNFNLEESFEQLDEVILEGNRDRNIEEAITGVTLIDVEKIKSIPLVLGERDILKAAVTLPGISTAGEGSSGFNVRGGRTDQNLILLDNAVIYNPSHFFGIFSALNPFTSGTVNIYKGSIPSEYGGRLSSVFDISTKDGNSEKFSGEASLGPVTSNLMLEIPVVKGKSALIVGGRATYSDWILKSLDDESLNNSQASFYDFVAKYNHSINENNELKATGYFSKDAFSITSDSLYSYSNQLVSLKWDHKINEKNTASVILSNSEYKFNIEFDGDSDNDFDVGYKINETEFKLKLRNIGSGAHKFDYGVSTKLYVVDPGNIDPGSSESIITPLSIPREKGLESALFISDSYTVNDKLLIDAGLRYSFYAALGASTQRIYEENGPINSGTRTGTQDFDKNEFIKTYGGPEVRVSARYFLASDLSVKASYNNTFQYIHTLSNNTTVSPTDTWKLTDLNIKPQEANQISLGLYKNFEGNMYELSLEGYYKKSKNILDYKVGAQLLLNEAIETEVLQGEGKAYGVEFLIKKNEGRLNGWLGYTYSRTYIKLDSEFNEERVNNGDFFPSNYDKPHDLSIVANYKFTRRFSASANFVYQTGRPVTYPIGSYIFNNAEYVFYSDRNQFRIPDYYRLDLSFNMEGNHKIKKFAHSFWSFSVYNVLGRNNPYSVFFVTEDGELNAYQSSIFSIPIPTLTYNFKF